MKMKKIDYIVQLTYRGFNGSETKIMTLKQLKDLYKSGKRNTISKIMIEEEAV